MSDDKYKSEKFNGTDFTYWSLQIEDLLYSTSLYLALLEKKLDSAKLKEWELLDHHAMSKIRVSLAQNVIFDVMEKMTTRELPKAFEETYEKPLLG